MVVLETARTVLRQLEEADFDDLHAICSDAAVMRYVGDLQPYSPEQTRKVIEEAQSYYRQYPFGPWAVTSKADGRFIGFAGLEFLPARTLPEVFYILAPAYWGQGYATELAGAIVEYGFRRCDLPQIGASFDPANRPSMRVAEKVGMHFDYEGVDEYNLPTIFYVMDNPYQAPAS